MEPSTFLRDGYLNGNYPSAVSSKRDVSYSCGSCGYELNLSSSNRNTSMIGLKYGKSIKRGIISFLCIDKSRFTQVEEWRCMPHFISKYSFGFLRPKMKLLCRKCGNHIGDAYGSSSCSSYSQPAACSSSETWRKYDIRIRALQPSSSGQVCH